MPPKFGLARPGAGSGIHDEAKAEGAPYAGHNGRGYRQRWAKHVMDDGCSSGE